MNWDAIGAISEGLGSLAVFLTLGYLALQVRHARQEVHRTISTARADANRVALGALADDRTLPLMLKANEVEGVSPHPFVLHAMEHWGMTEVEAWRLAFALSIGWQYRIELIPHVENMSPMERHEFETTLRALYGQPGVHGAYYQVVLKSLAHPDAIRYIEGVLAESV